MECLSLAPLGWIVSEVERKRIGCALRKQDLRFRNIVRFLIDEVEENIELSEVANRETGLEIGLGQVKDVRHSRNVASRSRNRRRGTEYCSLNGGNVYASGSCTNPEETLQDLFSVTLRPLDRRACSKLTIRLEELEDTWSMR